MLIEALPLIDLLEFPYQLLTLRACLHGGGEPQVGEVTRYGQAGYLSPTSV